MKKASAMLGFLILAVALFSLCAGNNKEPEADTGGDCLYKTVNGRCTVLTIEEGGSMSPVSVKFTFSPSDDLDLILGGENDLKTTLSNTGRIYAESSKDLSLACLDGVSYPKKADLEKKCNLKENKVVPCRVQVLDSGTCTSLIFSFTGI